MKYLRIIVLLLLVPLSASSLLAGDWYAEDYWKHLNGPFKDNIITLYNFENVLMAGAENQGLHKLDSGDNEWTHIPGDIDDETVLAVLHTNDNNLVAGTYNGLFASSNRGNSWHKSNDSYFKDAIVYSLIKFGSNIYAGTGQGIAVSYNNGANWQKQSTILSGKIVFKLLVINDRMYAITALGLYYFDEEDRDWEKPEGIGQDYVSDMITLNNGNILAGSYGGLFESKDNGMSWERRESKFDGKNIIALFNTGDILLLSTVSSGSYYSSDNGNSWEYHYSLKHTRSYCFGKMGEMIYAGTGDGVYISKNDGKYWGQFNFGLHGTIVPIIERSGDSIYAVSANHLFRTWNKSERWLPFEDEIKAADIRCVDILHNTMAVGTENNWYFLSTDLGKDWQRPSLPESVPDVNDILLWPDGNISLATSNGIFSGKQLGENWAEAENDYSAKTFYQFLRVNSYTAFAASSDGLYKSRASGDKWTKVNAGFDDDELKYLAMNKQYLFAASKDKIFRSLDMGGSWHQVEIELPKPANILSICAGDDYVFVAAKRAGILASDSDGDIWRQLPGPDTEYDLLSLAIGPEGYLFAGSHDNGIFRTRYELDKRFLRVDANPDWKQIVVQGSEIEYTLSIRDDFGNTVADAELRIYDGITRSQDTLISDLNGKCNYSTTVPYTKHNGLYYIRFAASASNYFGSGLTDYEVLVDDPNSTTESPETGVLIYPNPASSYIIIDNASISLPYVELVNMLSGEVIRKPVEYQSAQPIINISGAMCGSYMLRYFGPNGWYNHKIIIKR